MQGGEPRARPLLPGVRRRRSARLVPPGREERKVVSALFADIVEFTEQADLLVILEEVRAIPRAHTTQASARDLERWGGTVEKFIGDAVMALFGAPVAREDDAERAVRAALSHPRHIKRLDVRGGGRPAHRVAGSRRARPSSRSTRGRRAGEGDGRR